MDDRLDLILTRLTEAILLKDWEVGFWKWHREFSRWLAMKVRPPWSSPQSASELMLLRSPHRSFLQYPLKREMRVKLVKLYFELAGASSLLLKRVLSWSLTPLCSVLDSLARYGSPSGRDLQLYRPGARREEGTHLPSRRYPPLATDLRHPRARDLPKGQEDGVDQY